jgi:hypothetical protein
MLCSSCHNIGVEPNSITPNTPPQAPKSNISIRIVYAQKLDFIIHLHQTSFLQGPVD